MIREEIEACWRDPRNWKWRFYSCKADPRVVVPKKQRWLGWTLNFAHPRAVPVLLLMIALTIVPVFIVISKGAGVVAVLATVAVVTVAVCLLCAYLSSRTE